jgi:hypothetical protein
MTALAALEREKNRERALGDDALDGLSDEQREVHWHNYFAALNRLAAAPIETADDLAVKLRTLREVLDKWGTNAHYWTPLLDSAIEGAERLAGR